jgi:membrane protein
LPVEYAFPVGVDFFHDKAVPMRIPIVSTLWKAGYYWGKDRASYLGAAIAYNALFSLAPLLILAIGMVGVIYGETEVKQRLISIAQKYIGAQGTQGLEGMVEQFWRPATTLWATIVGFSLLIFAASNFFVQLGTALTMIWNLPTPPQRGWLWPLILSYLFAFAMVIMTGAFVFGIVASDIFFKYLVDRLGDNLPGGAELWDTYAPWLGTVVLLTLMFTLTFRFLSSRMIPYRKLWGGALTAALLFLVGRWLFGLYLHYMGDSLKTAFGASSSLVIFLIWIYYSAQILFFGAEVVKVKLEPA